MLILLGCGARLMTLFNTKKLEIDYLDKMTFN